MAHALQPAKLTMPLPGLVVLAAAVAARASTVIVPDTLTFTSKDTAPFATLSLKPVGTPSVSTTVSVGPWRFVNFPASGYSAVCPVSQATCTITASGTSGQGAACVIVT